MNAPKSRQFALGIVVALSCIAFMGAVNGVFANITASGFVNAVSGYQVNGAAGSSGQALCSNGTDFNTPCSIMSPTTIFNQTVDANGTAQTQRLAFNLISGTNMSVGCADNGGAGRTDCTFNNTFSLPNVGTAGTYNYPISTMTTDAQGRVSGVTVSSVYIHLTCVTGGCYKRDPDGLITEILFIGSLNNNTTTTVPLLFPMPTSYIGGNCSDNSSRVQTGNTQAIGINVVGLSAPFSQVFVLGPSTALSASCTVWGD